MQKQIMIKLLEQKITKQVHHLLTSNKDTNITKILKHRIKHSDFIPSSPLFLRHCFTFIPSSLLHFFTVRFIVSHCLHPLHFFAFSPFVSPFFLHYLFQPWTRGSLRCTFFFFESHSAFLGFATSNCSSSVVCSSSVLFIYFCCIFNSLFCC